MFGVEDSLRFVICGVVSMKEPLLAHLTFKGKLKESIKETKI